MLTPDRPILDIQVIDISFFTALLGTVRLCSSRWSLARPRDSQKCPRQVTSSWYTDSEEIAQQSTYSLALMHRALLDASRAVCTHTTHTRTQCSCAATGGAVTTLGLREAPSPDKGCRRVQGLYACMSLGRP